MDALGRLFDIGLAWAPVDTQSAAITGKRIACSMFNAVTIVVIKAAGTANDDPVFTLKQHTAYTGGTTADLDALSYYYLKSETTLDNDEAWVRVAEDPADAEITGGTTTAEEEGLYVFEVDVSQMGDDYTHISLDLADTGAAGAQLAAAIYLPHELRYQRKPANLSNLLRPNAADA